MDLSCNILDEVTHPVSVNPFGSSNPFRLPNAFITPKQPQQSFIYLCLVRDDIKVAENSFFYLPDKYLNWPKTRITTKISAIDEQNWELKLACDVAAKDVRIVTDSHARLSDNFINLLNRDERTVQINTKQQKSAPHSLPQIKILSVESIFQD